jgi:hypothetical protein
MYACLYVCKYIYIHINENILCIISTICYILLSSYIFHLLSLICLFFCLFALFMKKDIETAVCLFALLWPGSSAFFVWRIVLCKSHFVILFQGNIITFGLMTPVFRFIELNIYIIYTRICLF